MRVTGKGSGHGGGHSGSGRRVRASEFRRRHRIGERLSGRVLSRESPGLAWVNIHGIELLARMETDPEEGQTMLFQVIRLEPDILLQELAVAKAQGDPLLPALHLFWSARSRLETRTRALMHDISAKDLGPDAARDAYLHGVQAEEQTARLFASLSQAIAEVNASLAGRGLGELQYVPWLMPFALSGEILVRPPGVQSKLGEIAVSFALPGAGQCEARIMLADKRASCRLFAEVPDAAVQLGKVAQQLVGPDVELTLQGVSTLPASAKAGITAALLSPDRPVQGRFVRRV